MADIKEGFSLRLWSLATFHTVSFVALLVIAVHLNGSLSAALRSLDTMTGFGAFLLLWAITWFATRVGLRSIRSPVGDVSLATIVFSTTVAGGWNGVGVFITLLLVGLVFAVVGGARGVPLFLVLSLESVIGGLLAFTVGAVVGLLYGLADALLLMFSARLFRWTEVNVRSGAGGL